MDDSPFRSPEAVPVDEAARLVRVSPKTVRHWLKRGLLPSVVIGRVRRIRLADLWGFLTAHVRRGWDTPCPQDDDSDPAALQPEDEVAF